MKYMVTIGWIYSNGLICGGGSSSSRHSGSPQGVMKKGMGTRESPRRPR